MSIHHDAEQPEREHEAEGFERAGSVRPLHDPDRTTPPPPPGERMTRRDVYSRPMAAGRVADGPMTKLRDWAKLRLTTELQRREADLEQQMAALPGVTRANTVAILSPKGGVGKTTNTFLLGNVLASKLNLRVVAIDANADFGTLAALAPDDVRSERSLADLLQDAKRLQTTAEIAPYVSRLQTGLHLLGAPALAEVMAQMTPGLYGQLLDLLRRHYEVVLLDLGTGITDPIAQFAIEQADQMVVITTPEWVTAATVLGALRHLKNDQATLVLNQAPAKNSGNREVIEANFRRQALSTRVAIPYDERLRTMLDSGTYDLDALSRATRVPIKELGLTIGAGLV
jgi:MinD-like ATPase involved in chromosome partitioning or flagellar assembly